jgi:hypothetical protein
MRIVKPGGNVMVKDTVIDDAPTGLVHYITIANDLDEPGRYRVRSQWEPTAGGIMYGEVAYFHVAALHGN